MNLKQLKTRFNAFIKNNKDVELYMLDSKLYFIYKGNVYSEKTLIKKVYYEL